MAARVARGGRRNNDLGGNARNALASAPATREPRADRCDAGMPHPDPDEISHLDVGQGRQPCEILESERPLEEGVISGKKVAYVQPVERVPEA